MTHKQKLALVAAQYVSQARSATRQGDLIAALAEEVSEEKAGEVLTELERLGLIDRDGLLTTQIAPSTGPR